MAIDKKNPVSPLKGLPSEGIVALVLLSINAHYERNAVQIEKMLAELKSMDHQELVLVLQGLEKNMPLQEAIPLLANWIEGKMDTLEL